MSVVLRGGEVFLSRVSRPGGNATALKLTSLQGGPGDCIDRQRWDA